MENLNEIKIIIIILITLINNNQMKTNRPLIRLFLSTFLGILLVCSQPVEGANPLNLYTPYTKITVPPGKSINYSIDIINNSEEIQNEEIIVSGMPRGWNYSLKAGGYSISKIAVLPNEKKTITLNVEVPFQVNKGNFEFYIKAGQAATLPLIVNTSSKGSNDSEFTTDQSNMEGTTKSTFSFKADLKNRSGNQQLFALMANLPRGWTSTFKANRKSTTSVEMEANSTQSINIDIKAPESVKAGTYKIPVKAESGSTTAKLDLEVVITGTYSFNLTTPKGLLSGTTTAGKETKVELEISNDGSSELKDIKLKAKSPSKWQITFDPKTIDHLQPGAKATVYASIIADKNAIPGDYGINIDAKTPEASSNIAYRMTVKTPLLWGWIGILIIIIALGSVFYLFKKFGRR
jgi:uncharacterized membrane protein